MLAVLKTGAKLDVALSSARWMVAWAKVPQAANT